MRRLKKPILGSFSRGSFSDDLNFPSVDTQTEEADSVDVQTEENDSVDAQTEEADSVDVQTEENDS